MDIDVFISYASEDLHLAQALYRRLRETGLKPWMDKPPKPYSLDGLRPGDLWEDRLREAISAAKYFVPLFSSKSVTKIGYVQSEFRQALSRLALVPAGSVYILPVRLEDCEIPRVRIDGISFAQYQYIDCFHGDFYTLVSYIAELEGNAVTPLDFTDTTVSSGDEFLANIRSHTRMGIDKSFSLSNLSIPDVREVSVQEVFDGEEIILRDLENFTLVGHGRVELTVEPRYATTLTFKNCPSVRIRGLSLGHRPDMGSCMGAVLKFEDCGVVVIEDCNLFGCGTYGIEAHRCDSVTLVDCNIFECSQGFAIIDSVGRAKLVGCELFDTWFYSAIEVRFSDLIMENSRVTNSAPHSISSNVFSSYRSEVSFSNVCIEIPTGVDLGLPDNAPGLTVSRQAVSLPPAERG
ncbi:TIR domain-containing protein [Limimaricola sp. G21655-S1]|uniref:TIR domain-containing protein n=1 Tax=Limimaricola sp. G21655-S1 TaxID=3014768 RepID=UPI0022AE9B4F|nr:TIR domain-containing protein [Limimaricola sp. G21655-S1]